MGTSERRRRFISKADYYYYLPLNRSLCFHNLNSQFNLYPFLGGWVGSQDNKTLYSIESKPFISYLT